MAEVLVSRDGAVTTVTLNRPEALNAITPTMHEALEDAFNRFAADDSQQVCIVTGAGERAFCAGSDVKGAAAAGGLPSGYPAHGYAGLIERFDCPKPFIAAVNGLALGGGFELALACDLIVATEAASFGLPEPLIGAIAIGGGLHRLARQLPLKQAMALILTSRRLPAREALALGLVNQLVPTAADLPQAVAAWCADILKGAPAAVRASKATTLRGLDEPGVAAAMAGQAGYPEFDAWWRSEDLKEGLRAFAEKRPPRWSGG
ncbi:MAG: enoyl-CoA hydratase/isomerase family protein [Sphingomonadales bacterium]|nr:enoyl-CoA hydratase/isomerase family protein [Sphingomonadales bacterium]